MASRQKISQMTPKGANLEATDLLEVSVLTGTGYGTYSITGQEIIDAASSGGGGDMLKSVYDPADTGIVLSASKEMVDVINKTGSPIPEGSIVYLKSSSSSGTHPEILLADADTEATSSKTLGAVYETIANNATGYVVTSGEVDNLDTSMYNIGDKLWLSQTAGQVTTTPPVQPAHTVFIGTVTRAQNGNGRILYAIQNGFELHELHDVLITSAQYGDSLEYNGTLWVNKGIKVTVECMDALTVDFYAPYDLKVQSVTNILNAPTTTLKDDGSTYTVGGGATIASGSKITVAVSTAAVVTLNVIKA
jgi:hypothetical protein